MSTDPDQPSAQCNIKAKRVLNTHTLDPLSHLQRECYYGDYICVDELISLMRNRTEWLEEKLFIRIHQINEIAMQQNIITL
jgi:hypothetical protein